MVRVAAFTGSSSGRSAAFADAAAAFGRRMAETGVEVVYGGGRAGLMGVLADAALAAGGTVIGVIPRFLVDAEVAHTGLTELHVVENMHERKALMGSLADAFVALPGGIGTLEELFEVWTWQKLGLHDKAVALLNPAGFWDPLLGALNHIRATGFIPDADHLLIADDADHFLSLAKSFAPAPSRWAPERT